MRDTSLPRDPPKPPHLPHSRTKKQAIKDGIKVVLPLIPGILPFALIAGTAAAEAGIPFFPALGLSVFVFAGASQLVFIELWNQEAPALILLATVLLVNLRFTMYSATMAPYLQSLSLSQRIPFAYLLTDQAALLSLPEFEKEPISARYFYLAGGLSLWVVWQIGSAAGILLGVGVPQSWSLDFAMPLSFLALLIPAIKNKTTAIAAATAGGSVLFTRFLPLNLGLITATLLAVAVAMFLERNK